MNKDDFLDRWSKRKLAVEQENAGVDTGDAAEGADTILSEPALPDKDQAALPDGQNADLIETESDEELVEPHPAEGIDIEKLEYDSDFTVFMHDKVPEALRRMALRKLWKSSPILANVDGLNDYDEDFSDAMAIFINSSGGVVSGAREQFMDDKPLLDDKDEINKGDRKADEQEITETDAEVSDAGDIGDGEDELELEPDTGMAAGEEQRLSEDADQKEISTVDAGDEVEGKNDKTQT